MRKLTTILQGTILLLFLVLSFGLRAQENAIIYTIANDVQVSANQLEFDLLLFDPDPSQNYEEGTVQAGIYLNPAVYNGGTVTCAIVAGTSMLNTSQIPSSVTFTQSANIIKLASKAPPGCGGGTVISQDPLDRTRVCRLRLTNTQPWTPNSLANLTFCFTTTPYPTKVSFYQDSDCVNTASPVSSSNVYSMALNLPLNATATPPAPFAMTGGGSYCAGGTGVEVGLAGSEMDVTYTLIKDGIAQVPTFPGTGAALTFGNWPAGIYTASGTSAGGTTPMTGSSIVTEIPTSTVEQTVSACDSYLWTVNGITYTTTGDYTFVDGCITYVLHLTITPSSTVEVTQSACDSYTWALNGVTYNASGDYTFVEGCVTNILHLTITASSTVEFTESACDTYTWAVNGVTYTASGDYTYVAGCVTNILHLTITPSSTVEVTQTACDSYTWAVNGVTYNASGDYTYVAGCVTNILHLTITPSSTVEQTEIACDSYTWPVNGVTYTASGDYTFVSGCVTHILHLTITSGATIEVTETGCDSYTWAVNGVTYTVSGDYTFVDGCLTYILHLTIIPSSTVEFTESACDSYTWALNGMTYTVSGDYTYTVGCVNNILHLTITPSSIVEFTESACDTYTWAMNGATYTVSGDYTYVMGCVTNILHLTITPSSTVEVTESACDSYTWALNGVTYTVGGDYTYVVGCVTNILHLTITPGSTVEFTETACESYTWALNGVTYNASGDYTFVVGCVTNILHLTITPLTGAAGLISGVTPVVEGDLAVPYSIDPILNATGYVWTYSGTGVTINGTGPAVTLDFAIGATSGTLSVYGTNSCGAGDASFFDITVTIAPCPATTWTGLINNDWFNPGNWVPCVPQAITMVTIPAGAPNYPTLVSPAACADITIASGASFIGSEFLTVGMAHAYQNFPVPGYHYISSSVQATDFDHAFPLNQTEVWAYRYDEPSGMWVNQLYTDPMVVGTGYSVLMNVPQVAFFEGQLNGLVPPMMLSSLNTSGDINRTGWNLLGNPYTSAILWDMIIKGSAVDGAVYVWNGFNYVSYVGGVGSLVGGIIPAHNGFFVKTMVHGDFLQIPLFARTHSTIPFYKDAATNTLSLRTDANSYSDQTFIHFNNDATAGFDSQLDAYKLMGVNEAPQVYSMITGDVLSVNTLPQEGTEVVNIGFKCGNAGTYTITGTGMETFDASTPIWLEDLKTGTMQNLRTNPVYTFNYSAGDTENRFRIHFKSAYSIPDNTLSGINIYSLLHTVVINNTSNLSGEAWIYDLTGRELTHAAITSKGETRIPVNAAVGNYIVKVITEEGVTSQKVFIR